MNLFRSEEHARDWRGFDAEIAERMLRPVAWWADVFSSPVFRERRRPDYVSWLMGEGGQAAFGGLRERLMTGV